MPGSAPSCPAVRRPREQSPAEAPPAVAATRSIEIASSDAARCNLPRRAERPESQPKRFVGGLCGSQSRQDPTFHKPYHVGAEPVELEPFPIMRFARFRHQ